MEMRTVQPVLYVPSSALVAVSSIPTMTAMYDFWSRGAMRDMRWSFSSSQPR